MDERLENLRKQLCLDWGELAQKLGISRAMLGFVRRGTRNPSAALLRRIRELEEGESSHSSNIVAIGFQDGVDWKKRALDAEAKLMQLRKAIQNFIKVTEHLEGAL